MSRLAGEETPVPAAAEQGPAPAAEGPEGVAAPEEAEGAGGSELTPPFDDPGPMGLAAIQERGLIVDVHEHIASLDLAPRYLAAMDELGIQTMCLMGSSKFTLTLNESVGFSEYDENNEELIKIVEAYPGRFEAWPTVNPEDPDKLAKIQDLVARGATGVKLYIGHGYTTGDNAYMFHTVAIDDPGMLPLYAWCEENYVPIMLHVNPFGEKTGFAQEFIATLTQFPDLKVIAPHFILSSVYNPRLEELLDTFPNLYSDISFGDHYMKVRLTYMSKYPAKFRRIFREYPDRFMFAADLVMIPGRPDDWAPVQFQAYIDMLTTDRYTTPAIREEVPEDERVEGEPAMRERQLTGLNLSDDLVSRILFRNYRAFRASRPSGTRITHEINWENMNQEPVDRQPGQAFPPPPK